MFGCGLVGGWRVWCVGVCVPGGVCWCVLVGVRVVVVSDAHVFWPLSCLFGFVSCFCLLFG